ncbi:hypothetical protein COS70_05045, partial [Candidatus Micrarchaeota archaeon CG06_land_8_20_14_3_00_50_6]
EPKARAMHQQVHSIRSIQSTIKVDSTLPLRDSTSLTAATVNPRNSAFKCSDEPNVSHLSK